ncbi:MAG: flagellar basal body-associated FliL family protein [Bdellovibrionota bacterium]
MAESKDPKKPTTPPPAAAPEAPAEPPPWLVKAKAIIAATGKVSKAIIGSPIIQRPKNIIKNFGLMGWMKVFTCFAVALLTYTVYKTAPQWKKFWKIPYLSTFESVADQKFNYASDSKVIRYSNDLLLPQHVVLINKIVVNVKPGKLSTANPMIAFDLYVRTDTSEASVEIKEREKQIQDHLQRFCEGLNYDQLQTEDGKQTWKNRMKRELNLVLNNGKVKDIFFKTLLIKP